MFNELTPAIALPRECASYIATDGSILFFTPSKSDDLEMFSSLVKGRRTFRVSFVATHFFYFHTMILFVLVAGEFYADVPNVERIF